MRVLFDICTNASVMMRHSWLWSMTPQFLKYVDIFTCPQINLYHLVQLFLNKLLAAGSPGFRLS